MGRETNKLDAAKLRAGMPVGRHWDGEGLYLEATETSAYWRLKYRFGGREKRISLGVFPAVSLAEARKARVEIKSLIHKGIDPSAKRKGEKSAARVKKEGMFSAVAEAWFDHKKKNWADQTRRKARLVLDDYLLPKLADRSIDTLATKDVAPVIREMSKDVPDLARKARQYMNGIVVYAIQDGLREEDRLLRLNGVAEKTKTESIPAATLPESIGKVLRKVQDHNVEVTRSALMICAYTAQRPGMVAAMEWSEISLDEGEWRIDGAKMKMRHAHIVPLPRQAVEIIKSMQKYTGGRGYMFPPLARQKTPHLNRDSLSKALRDMGLQGIHATHGFRSMFRTAARERLEIDTEVLEAQLAHAKKGNVQKAYDRTTYGAARRKAMQQWADYIDELRSKQSARQRA